MQLFIDGGLHGALTGAHAHADALSLDLALDTGPLFSDPGSRSYVGQDRDLFRSTAWHSTVAIPGRSSAEPGGPFRWRTFPKTTISAWETGSGFAWFDGWHDGWTRLAPGLRHRRSILCLEGLGIIVLDRLTAAVPRELPDPEIRWHCATGVTATSAGPTVRLSRDGKPIAGLASDTPGRVVTEAGRSSTCYGADQESVFIVCRPGRKALATGVATAILVGDDAGACLARVSADGRGSWTLSANGMEARIEQTERGVRWSVDRGMRPGLPPRLDLVTAEPW
jgi:hypothetical protein